MPKVMFEGQEFDIPESASTETLIERLGAGNANLIRRSPDGREEVLPQGGHIQLNDGDRLSAISRFRTGAIVIIDGHQIPDGTTTEQLLEIPDRIHAPLRHVRHYRLRRVRPRLPSCRHFLADGQRYGTVERFETGGVVPGS